MIVCISNISEISTKCQIFYEIKNVLKFFLFSKWQYSYSYNFYNGILINKFNGVFSINYFCYIIGKIILMIDEL